LRMIREVIKKLVEGRDLTEEEATSVMEEIMTGTATDAQIASFLIALRVKGETVEEISGLAKVMRDKATRIECQVRPIVDTCGTGADASGTFNISTVSAFVAAGAGVKVAKHGNRSVSSKCGSADLLSELGVNIEAPPDVVARCIDEVGIGFLYAPSLHKAMKYAIGPRREMGIRTVFNILGPLTNPARATAQILGVYEEKLTEPLAVVLSRLGCRHAYVVHGEDGLDEITTTSRTRVSQVSNGTIKNYHLKPEDFGITRAELDQLRGGDPEENSRIALDILKGELGPKRDIVLLNAGAAIAVAGLASDIKEGIEMATESLDCGAALDKLEKLKAVTNI
jgi:anthranilate phosphoribosyltransferase